jgi:trehalose 6-phosphate synthase
VSDVVLASDRGPITFAVVDGHLQMESRQSSVTAILQQAATRVAQSVTWLAASCARGDRLAMATGRYRSIPNIGYRFEPVLIGRSEYQSYYNDAGVRMLWIAHHGLWDELAPSRIPPPSLVSFIGPYQAVNQRVAGRIAEVSHPTSLVLIQDYQLATAPRFLRRLHRQQPIALFTHTPFGDVDSLRRLPRPVLAALVDGMLGADLLGFQRRLWADRFLQCCEMMGAAVDAEMGLVTYGNRRSWVRCYPVPIDASTVLGASRSPETAGWLDALRRDTRGLRIVRVDRLDPAKNTLRGFDAFERLLETVPELVGEVHLLACLVPSRSEVPEYRWYGEQVWETIGHIQERYPDHLSVHFGNDMHRALAALRTYDVLLVNPLADGMNLVAQEGALVNTENGVVVLSRGAGCSDRLPGAVLIEDARDVEATSRALSAALRLPERERHERASSMRQSVVARAPVDWLTAQLADLDAVQVTGKPLRDF